MNEIYLSVFLSNLAESMISLFVPIYLYSLHYSVVMIIFFFFICRAGSAIFSLPVAQAVAKAGAKHSVLISTPFLIVYYLGLHFLPQYPILFFILPLGITFRALFYNFGFGLNFVDHLDRKKIGSELSFLAILAIISTIISPLVAGLVIVYFGYSFIFIVGSILLFLSAIPLFLTKDNYRQVSFTWKDLSSLLSRRGNIGMVLSFTGYAIESEIGGVIWPIFLIMILGGVEQVGYLTAASSFVAILVLYFVGKITDRFDLRKMLNLGTLFYFLGWIGSLFADNSLKMAFVNFYKSVSGRFLILPWSSMFYKMMQRDTYFQLVVAQDFIFNASRLVIMPFIMAIFMFWQRPFVAVFIVAALFTLLYPFLNRVYDNGEQELI